MQPFDQEAFSKALTGFNPHPARRPDATRLHDPARYDQLVSILTRPEGRMQLGDAGDGASGAVLVSILTRPEGRMQRGDRHRVAGFRLVSILTRPEGRMQLPRQRCCLRQSLVSILTRPEGRMQLSLTVCSSSVSVCFNPHPARRPDATSHRAMFTPDSPSFNPHPARRPDATPISAFPICSARTS